MAINTEVLVVGAGPGGYVAALKLGKLGKKTLLVEKDRLGGVCLNSGCIPSKALIHFAGQLHKVRKAKAQGLEAPDLRLNWPKVVDWKNTMVAGLNRGIATLAKGNNVSVLSGTARLTGAHEASVAAPGGTETVAFESAIVVTGSKPIPIPGFAFDGAGVISSTEALDLREIPARLMVIGGGVIGLELGTVFAKLGSQVTVVEFLPQILSGLEPSLVAPVARNLQRLGMEVMVNSKARGFEKGAGGLLVTVETPAGNRSLEVDKILLSVGRIPNSKDLGIEDIGISCDAKGHILVNDRFQTKVPNIYAVGDVVGPPYLAHKASREAVLAALCIAGRPQQPRGAIPAAVFTDPEIAAVGETETEARNRGAEVMVGRFPFAALGKAQAIRETEGFVKIVADKNTHKVLGGAIVGPSAADIIGELCLAVKAGVRVDDLAATVHPHPTLGEAIQEAAEACLGEALHILTPSAS
ncbi:MAG TPA: dihydrolipoyl dehydrogenase [Elusimicrobia bacterium]|nr:dihydrolipoyl dehydrogenase [Elusimicrobiota bacterium]HBT60887.1 dihydrolipoyl dehydrogenase [Elusimicrobiota bacterium]